MSIAMRAARAGRASAYPSAAIVRGDPGLFGFLKKAGKAIVGGAVGFATGGVGGAVAGVASTLQRKTVKQAVAAPTMTALPSTRQLLPPLPVPGTGLALQSPFALQNGGAMATKAQADAARCKSMSCPSGFHPNKADYFLKDGTFVPAGTRCVKNRRRNPLNPRALDRSLGRIAATGKAVKALGFTPIASRKVAQAGRKPRKRRK